MQRRAFLTGALALGLGGRAAHAAEAVKLPNELVSEVSRLNGRVTLGARNGDVTLIEFFDYNCPYCRVSAPEIRPLLAADKALAYVLVNYAVLSEASILASKVALAFTMQKAGRYLEFHERLFARKGQLGADVAIDTALALGADRALLLKDADSDAVTKSLIASAKLGENLGLVATPSYIIGNEGFQGYLDVAAKRRVIASMRACEKTSC